MGFDSTGIYMRHGEDINIKNIKCSENLATSLAGCAYISFCKNFNIYDSIIVDN